MTEKSFKAIQKFPSKQQGQNGVTFEGTEISTNQRVVIKILYINERIGFRHPDLQEKIKREAEILQDIDHKYVVKFVSEVKVNDLLSSDECSEDMNEFRNRDLQCIVTEYIEGKSFESFRNDYVYLPEDALKLGVRLIFQIGYGLAHAHSRQIAHRDLHPNNIIIRNHKNDLREAVIIDFGLGRKFELLPSVNASELAKGTFRAPEMTNDKFVPTLENCTSADLFSLVATFLWWLTDGASSSLILIRDLDNKERRYHGLNRYIKDSRPEGIFNIIGKDRWKKLNEIIDNVLVDPSVEPCIERTPKTVTEWLDKLREIFPDYDPGDPSEGYFEDLGNGVAIEMIKVPERDIYLSKIAITIEQWQEIMGISPFDTRANEDLKLTAKGLNFDEINDFIKKLNLLTNKHYRLPISDEIIYFDNFQDLCYSNNEKLYILHLDPIRSKQINICYKSNNNRICFEKGIYRSYRCVGSNNRFCFYVLEG